METTARELHTPRLSLSRRITVEMYRAFLEFTGASNYSPESCRFNRI